MTLAVPLPASAAVPAALTSVGQLEPAPLVLPPDLRLTPEQFELVCEANPDAVLELSADGSLLAMTPSGGESSNRNSRLLIQLGMVLANFQPNLRIFNSSGGFRLPDGSVLCPDASLVLEARWQALTPEQRRRFPPLCPDLVVELASPSDAGPRGLTDLRQKMDAYQRNGARIGWLLIPQERTVEVWGPLDGGEPGRRIEAATRLEGEPAFPGLVIDLEPIWAE